MAKRKVVRGRWSNDEVKLLKRLFPNKSTREVAGKLGRSCKSVEMKAFKMGLKKTSRRLKSLRRV